MEAVDPIADYLVTRGTLRSVELLVYDPTKDAPTPSDVAIRGSRGTKRTGRAGDEIRTTTTWTIAAAAPDLILRRPPLLSQLKNHGDLWRIDAISANPQNNHLFRCECTLVIRTGETKSCP